MEKNFLEISAMEIVKLMKTGWNLGNTLDAISKSNLESETSWGQPYTTKAMLETIAKAGFKCLRIPISWANHILPESDYIIDPCWLNRVKEIVDWALELDQYVIINDHHDNLEFFTDLTEKKLLGYYPKKESQELSQIFLTKIWAQISEIFKNYDEHLIFETLNEPRPRNTDCEWVYKEDSEISIEAAEVLNNFNQIIVDTIRASGANNEKRFIMVPGLSASPQSVLANTFRLPKDSIKDRLIVSIHMYTPYVFAGASPGTAVYTPEVQKEFTTIFEQINQKFISKGIPAVIGEYGATNKNNLEDRTKWFSDFIKYSKKLGMCCCLWDNGDYLITDGNYLEHFGYYDRINQKFFFPELIEAIMKEFI